MTPQIGGMYRFPTGIRVVVGAPDEEGLVPVAQPLVKFTPHGEMVLLCEDNFGRPYDYPGLSFLQASMIDTEYKLHDIVNIIDGRPWKYYTAIKLKDDAEVKAIAKKRGKNRRKALKKKRDRAAKAKAKA